MDQLANISTLLVAISDARKESPLLMKEKKIRIICDEDPLLGADKLPMDIITLTE